MQKLARNTSDIHQGCNISIVGGPTARTYTKMLTIGYCLIEDEEEAQLRDHPHFSKKIDQCVFFCDLPTFSGSKEAAERKFKDLLGDTTCAKLIAWLAEKAPSETLRKLAMDKLPATEEQEEFTRHIANHRL